MAQNPSQHTRKNTTDHTLPTLNHSTPKRTPLTTPFQPCIHPLHQAPLEHSPGWEQLPCTAPGRDQPFHRHLSFGLMLPFCPRDLETSCTGLTVSSLNRIDPPPPSVFHSWPAMLVIQGDMFHSPLSPLLPHTQKGRSSPLLHTQHKGCCSRIWISPPSLINKTHIPRSSFPWLVFVWTKTSDSLKGFPRRMGWAAHYLPKTLCSAEVGYPQSMEIA